LLVPVPWWIAEIQASILGVLPGRLLTSDQVTQLRSNNVVSEEAVKSGRTLTGLGIQPQSLGTILPSYLWRFRAAGQFQRKPAG
jgi:NADH dehydrogenase